MALTLFLSACAEQKPEKRLPREVVNTSPQPYTGEVGKPKDPGVVEDSGLQVYQINEDGTSQEVLVGQDEENKAETVGKGIVITADGFVPPAITMKVGQKLMIQNMDTADHQPSSDPHPEHSDCPELNAGKVLKENEFYEVTVGEPKTCGIHDHLNPELKATITITE